MDKPVMLEVEVAYARRDEQCVLVIEVEQGTPVRDVLLKSSIVESFPEIDVLSCPIGIFGRAVDDNYSLLDGDRIEIYRPLVRDPRDARRELAKRGLTIDRQ